jgi:hypothetical protein
VEVGDEDAERLRALDPSEDEIYWCGRQLQYEVSSPTELPERLVDPAGEPIDLRKSHRRGDSRRWTLVVEGRPELPLHAQDVQLICTERDWKEGLDKVRDAAGRSWMLGDDGRLEVEELPDSETLTGDNNVRLEWDREEQRHSSTGVWIQLERPESEKGDSGTDPRAHFCEPDVDEIWTQPKHSRETVIRITSTDRENYRLCLEEAPPENADRLYLPVNTINLKRQRAAVHQLQSAPLPHHRGLLRLIENPEEMEWPKVVPNEDVEWRILDEPDYDGTAEQREFVEKALATPDFAFLDGPPGSGKTTTICELILQLIERGERILLCASTHCAIDNVLERIAGEDNVEPVRIGREGRVDERVQQCQIDRRKDSLRNRWAQGEVVRQYASTEEMAERMVVQTSNLTCGTTMGIVNHPLLRAASDHSRREQGEAEWLTRQAHFDVLIVDEASKTTLQEFLVPAMLAERWVVVGDVRQLAPYVDDAEMAANLRQMDRDDGSAFPPAHQRACLVAFRLLSREAYVKETRWLVVEEKAVLEKLDEELEDRRADEAENLGPVVKVTSGRGVQVRENGEHVEVGSETLRGNPADGMVWLRAASVVLVREADFGRVSEQLPGDLVRLTAPFGNDAPPAWNYRNAYYRPRAPRYDQPAYDRGDNLENPVQAAEKSQRFLRENRWAGEVAWRSLRLQELRGSDQEDKRARYLNQIERLAPRDGSIDDGLSAFRGLALPSLLESLQKGIPEIDARRSSALNEGMEEDSWEQRAVLLPYQHRMHPEISRFPRKQFYDSQALQDANTLEGRTEEVGWHFKPSGLEERAIWVDVAGHVEDGVNEAEVERMADLLGEFANWARPAPSNEPESSDWEVALLSFYVPQYRAISRMLQGFCEQPHSESHFELSGVSITCGTVDRFQGREADVVMLSMRNTGRVGFLDSPNRLNVALTRARHLLLVLGNRDYFKRCKVPALSNLASQL